MTEILWKVGRTGKAGDTVGVLQRLVSNTFDRAHHLLTNLHLVLNYTLGRI